MYLYKTKHRGIRSQFSSTWEWEVLHRKTAMTFQNEHMVKIDQWEGKLSPISQWDARICVVIFPTDHLNPDTGQMDNKDDDEFLLTTREKMAKMMISSALKQLFNKCKQLQCNDCRAGWGMGTWGGSEGCDVRMWRVTRVWHVGVWWAADWIMSLSSQPDDRKCEELKML